MSALLRDLRLGFRTLWRAPVFGLTVIVTLALGIGATTALFTVVNAVLLDPLPFPQSRQLVQVLAQRAACADVRVGLVSALSRLAGTSTHVHRPGRVGGAGDDGDGPR